MTIQHHLRRQRSSGRDVPLELPRAPLPTLPRSGFTAGEGVQTIEIGNGREEAAVERMRRLVKVHGAEESDKTLDDLCEEHEDEEDEGDGLEEEHGVGDPVGRVGGHLELEAISVGVGVGVGDQRWRRDVYVHSD
jgi:hypothetical protein